MPSRSAAVAPRTTAGRFADAASSQRPCATVPRTACSRLSSADVVVMPPVYSSGTRSVRRTVGSSCSTADTDCTGPIRRSIPGASSGSTASSPRNDRPGVIVSRFVPEVVELGDEVGARRRADADDRHQRRDADRDAEGRQRRPQAARAQPDGADGERVPHPQAARRHPLGGRGAHAAASAGSRSSPTIAPSSSATRRGRRARELAVVRDQDDRRPAAVQVAQQVEDGAARAAVEVAGRLVGQDQRRLADQRPGDGDPLALAARELRRLVPEPVLEADALQRRLGAPPPFADRHPGVQQARGDVVGRRQRLQQVEALEHEADAPRAQGRQLAVAHPPGVDAGDVHRPGRRPVEQAHELQQGRLARARRADHGHELALLDRQLDVAQDVAGRGVAAADAAELDDAHRSACTTRVPSSMPSPVTCT